MGPLFLVLGADLDNDTSSGFSAKIETSDPHIWFSVQARGRLEIRLHGQE